VSDYTRRPLALLDRDGTIIAERHYLSDPADVELLPGAGDAIRVLRKAGFAIAVVSNQSAIARGFCEWSDVQRVNSRLSVLLAAEGAFLDGFFICPHHPDVACACRKPAPGLVHEAAAALRADLSRSVVVGDKDCDIGLGEAIGATTVLVRSGYGQQTERAATARPDFVIDDLRSLRPLIARLHAASAVRA
jgi:histidinol-phosphate phosphatase family protein